MRERILSLHPAENRTLQLFPDSYTRQLRNLPRKHIAVCRSCKWNLRCQAYEDYFDLLDKKQVGETTNMLDIVTAMQLADRVINI
jgi:hypothetical protein